MSKNNSWKANRESKITYMAFEDLKKAFDNTNWIGLFKNLEETEMEY